MKRILNLLLFICIFSVFFTTAIFAGRPFITHLYNADPSGHCFEGRMYVYPSHDKNVSGWFDMEDYHVYSSADLKQWVDHGVVLHYKDADWVAQPDPAGATPPAGVQVYDPQYQHPRFWAPDCAVKNDPQGSTYYFYYCAHDKDVADPNDPMAFKIAVATSKSPAGPFVPVKYNGVETYIPGSYSMDPCVFVDDDGSAYMVFGGQGYGGIPAGQGPRFVKLKSNMIEFDGTPQQITSGVNYWFEASWLHARVNPADGKKWYYLSYSTGSNDPDDSQSTIHYAMNDNINNINGWVYKGEVIDVVVGWTNHHSFAKFKTDPFGNEEWYAFFHNTDMAGPQGEYIGRRSICTAKLNYNTDATMQLVDQSSVNTLDAYSRIKAMLFTGQSGVEKTEDITSVGGIVDIGKQVSFIENGDYIYFNNIDFGSTGATSFEATVTTNTSGGKIEIRDGSTTGTKLGELNIINTGGWSNWVTLKTNLYNKVTERRNIYLVFVGGSGYLFNLNWFKFIRPVGIPVGYSVGFKSLNPNCIDIDGNQGQKYLCAETLNGHNQDICANRPGVWGGWEKFTVLDNIFDNSKNNVIQLNSSNNGKNVAITGINTPLRADGGDYRGTDEVESFYWIINSDGTLTLQNYYSNKYICVDTWTPGFSNNPAKAYDNRTSVDYGEKFYCEAGDAPIGCIVAFKSLNSDCRDIDGNVGTKYLCVDTLNNLQGALCSNRPAVGGLWEKFLVVDAENGYIALKSLSDQKGEYIYCSGVSGDYPAYAWGGQEIDSDLERFQWRNNGDGTVSLKNVGTGMYLCVDTDPNTGKSNNPARVYSNRPSVVDVPYSWEKFYCQIVQ